MSFCHIFPLPLSLSLSSSRKINTKISFRCNCSLLWPISYFGILVAEVPCCGSESWSLACHYGGQSSIPSHQMLDVWLTQWYCDIFLSNCVGCLCQCHSTNATKSSNSKAINFAVTASPNQALPFYFNSLFRDFQSDWVAGINSHSALQSELEYLFL